MSSYKLKEKPETFYVCRKDKECCSESGCSLNGGGCFHTADISHAAYDKHPKFKRHSDGSMWEVMVKQ